MDVIEKIQSWYASQCDGDWEHQFGVTIDTLDNPGWSVKIDLVRTSLENVSVDPLKKDHGDQDWIFCEVRNNEFLGAGDPSKLRQILEFFITLTEF
ncbi:MAG TPA: immunity 53 family protein [Blastocatellia bacterium]|nr:immunity 53 family protein [Blastocatellia bacterium]